MSAQYQLNTADGLKILKVLLYALGSSACAYFLVILPQINLPPQVAILAVPLINSLLFAGEKFFEHKVEESTDLNLPTPPIQPPTQN